MTTTYNQAKRLKELGYDKDCLYYYDNEQIEQSFFIDNECKVTVDDLLFDFNNDKWWGYPEDSISAPSISDALQWIREEYRIVCGIGVIACCKYPYYGAYIDSNNQEITLEPKEKHPLAESALLDELLTYLEQKR